MAFEMRVSLTEMLWLCCAEGARLRPSSLQQRVDGVAGLLLPTLAAMRCSGGWQAARRLACLFIFTLLGPVRH